MYGPQSTLACRKPAPVTRTFAAFGLFGDPGEGAKVLPGLNGLGRMFADTYQALNRGAHEPYAGDLGQLIADSRQLAGKIRDLLP